jgi:integrase
MVSLGPWPDVTLERARELAKAARRHIKEGRNPADVRRHEKTKEFLAASNTFGKIGLEFLALDDTRAKRTVDKHKWLFELLAPLHKKPVTAIDAPGVLKVLRSLEAQGKREAAHRCAQFAARVFRYAIQSGYGQMNPAADLRGALKPKKTESHAGITDPIEFGGFMELVDTPGYSHATVYNGIRLLARTFVRPGELRQALWSEFDLDKAEWKIPASRMKMRRPHLVPLSTQAVAILREQLEVSGESPFVFPGVRSGRPMSDAGMGVSIKNMFIPAEYHVPHGFRVSASTLLNELGFDSALIELQLSHAKRDKVAGIYDRSQRVAERKIMMQRWSDYIDELKAGK